MTRFTTAGVLATAVGLFVAGTADAQIVIGSGPVYGGRNFYSPGAGVVRSGYAQPFYNASGLGAYNTGYRPYAGGYNNFGGYRPAYSGYNFGSGFNYGRYNYSGFNSGYRNNFGYSGYNYGRSGGYGGGRRFR